MKNVLYLALTWMVSSASWAATISEVEVRHWYPWQSKVVVDYRLTGNVWANVPSGKMVALSLTVKDKVGDVSYTATALTDADTKRTSWSPFLSGDTGVNEGMHTVTWDFGSQNVRLRSTNTVFTVAYEDVNPMYCVIDLAKGHNAASFPVHYLDRMPWDVWPDEYKLSKIVLRRIEPGSFMMLNEANVTLTKPYYIGVYEMTQKQYYLVTGSNLCADQNSGGYYAGDTRPVGWMTYNLIRGDNLGSNWPTDIRVDPESFMGILRTKTGLPFDLPTESQWEYACRAGTTSAFNNGGSSEANMSLVGRWYKNINDNRGGYGYKGPNGNSVAGFTEVGSYTPNAWGLYDMHGNMAEWCLDHWCSSYWLSYGTDPQDPKSSFWQSLGSASTQSQYRKLRVVRGGCYANGSIAELDSTARKSYKVGGEGDADDATQGFRLALTIEK